MQRSEGKCHCGCNARTRKTDSSGRWNAHCAKRWNGQGAAGAKHSVAVRRATKAKVHALLQQQRLGQRVSQCAPSGLVSVLAAALPPTRPADGGDVLARLTVTEGRVKELEAENLDLRRANASLRPARLLG